MSKRSRSHRRSKKQIKQIKVYKTVRRAPANRPRLHDNSINSVYSYTTPKKTFKRFQRQKNRVLNPIEPSTKPDQNNSGYSQQFINQYHDNEIKRAKICARRKIRREVLFASGKGGSKVRPPKYKQQSTVQC